MSYKWLVWCVGPKACVLNHDAQTVLAALKSIKVETHREVKDTADPQPKSWNSTQTEFSGLALHMTPGIYPKLNCPKETLSSLGTCGSPRKQHPP